MEYKIETTTPVKCEVWLKAPFRNFGAAGTRNTQLEKVRENEGWGAVAKWKTRLISFQL